MGRFILCACIAGFASYLSGVVSLSIQDSARHNITYNTSTIISVGQCVEKRCSYTYKTITGEYRNSVSKEPVSVGQTVYQTCWTEKKLGHQCYVDYTPSKQ